MGGSDIVGKKPFWQQVQIDLEDLACWYAFCGNRILETRKELRELESKERVKAHTRYCPLGYFVDPLKKNRIVSQGALLQKEKEEHPEFLFKLEEMEKIIDKHRFFDAFLSKRTAERYQELNTLFRKRKDDKNVLYNGRNHLQYYCGRYNKDPSKRKFCIPQSLWVHMCENLSLSSGSVSESKSATKSSTTSAPRTVNNECGI
jgi:hypothetical protein